MNITIDQIDRFVSFLIKLHTSFNEEKCNLLELLPIQKERILLKFNTLSAYGVSGRVVYFSNFLGMNNLLKDVYKLFWLGIPKNHNVGMCCLYFYTYYENLEHISKTTKNLHELWLNLSNEEKETKIVDIQTKLGLDRY